MALLLAMLFVIPVSAGQGWMFRADEVHSGVYDDSGILPIAEVRWSTYTNGEVTSSPAVVDGVVYVGSSDNQVYAFNTADGTKIWSTYTNGAVTSSPAVVGGVVYVGSNDNQVYAFNTADGTKIWSTYTNGAVTSSPAAVGGVVYVGSSDHQVYAFNATTGTKLWSTYTNSEITSSPAVVDGVVYIGSNDNQVYAFNSLTGTKIWNTYTNGAVTSSPSVINGVVYVGSKDSQIYALNATTGSKIWSTYTNGEVTSSPAIVDGIVYIGSKDRQVYAFNAGTGAKLWSTYTNGEVTSSPAVVDGVVYIGSNDRQVYALNADTGTVVWSYYTNGIVSSSPAVVEGVVYIGSGDRQVYAFGNKAPVPAFSATPLKGTPPLTVTFTDESTESITGWHWDFGDGSTSSVQNPVHTYPGPGKYTVNLTVMGPGGTVSLAKPDYIEVTFEFSGSPRSGEPPLTVTFSDTLPADTTGRHWDFGDGSTSTDKNPVHTYTTPGSFTVTLNATGPGWASTLTKKNYIGVSVVPNPALRWKFQTGITSTGSPPVLYNGVAYIDGGTTLFAVDTRTGTERWRFGTGEECSISEVYGGVVYVRAGTTLFALDTQSGSEKWRFTAPEKIGCPSRYIGVICFNSGNAVYGIDINTGTEKWRVTKANPFTEVTIGEGIVSGDLYAGSGKTLYALQTHTGKERWHKDYKDVVGLKPVVSTSHVIIGTNKKSSDVYYDQWTFHAVGMTDGKELWSTGVYRYPVGSPQIAEGTFLFVSNEGWLAKIRAIDLTTGKELWSYSKSTDYRDRCDAKYVASGARVLACFAIHYSQCGGMAGCRSWDSWTLVSLDRETGKMLWEEDLYDAGVKGLPVISHDNAYMGLGKTDKGNLLALNMNGTTMWYSQVGEGDFGFPVFSNGVIYGKGSDGYFYAVGNPLSFSATPTAGMAPLTVAFTDTTPQATSGWSWVFGDGTTSTEQNPVHTYTLPGTYTVKFTASDAAGIVSHTKENFIGVATNLSVTRINPANGVKNTTIQVTITGGNFTGGMTANLTRGAAVIPITNIAVVDSATISGTLVIPGEAQNGLYDLFITRASDGNLVKVPGAFMVLQYPAPIVTSIDPTSTKAGSLQRFTLAGNNFQLGATVGFTSVTGAKLTTTAVTNSESEIILTATFPVNGIGPWNVTVTNPDGGSATLQNALEVMPSNADSPVPTVSSVTPSKGTAGMPLTLTISGADFTKGSSVKLTRGPDELLASRIILMGATSMRATIQVPSGATPGQYDLVVMNSEGQAGMLPGAVTIGGGNSPVLTSFSPATMYAGATTSFTLAGNRFQDGAMVVFENATYGTLMPDNVGITMKKITGSLTIPEGAATGAWSVTVTNPDGGTVTLPGALTVLSPSGDNGDGPMVVSVKPATGSAGKTVGLIITGERFTKGSTVALTDHAGDIQASKVLTLNPSKMFVIVKIPTNAVSGMYNVVVTDNTGRSGTLPGAFTVL
ncbi:MAG: outer membrane biogenesis protein BamB [Methanoregulaceae archaeon PtaB.Bin108]|nr:MAG: outer membrane biogenesis protein BamB [Methanoregulaceae archaeon PtaB.Bin108]